MTLGRTEYRVVVVGAGILGLYTAWHLANAARIGNQVTLTRLDMIGF